MTPLPAPLAAWRLPLALALACIAAQALGDVEALRLERAKLLSQPWRLLTGQLVHLGWAHLGLNLAGLWATWALFGQQLRPATTAAALAGCALAVGLGLYWLDPDVGWYVGLSGVLHGLFALGAVAGLGRAPLFHGALLVGLAAKLAWEQAFGASDGSAALVGGAVVVNAHLYGALAGLAFLPLTRLIPERVSRDG